jgi:hypothetical protein
VSDERSDETGESGLEAQGAGADPDRQAMSLVDGHAAAPADAAAGLSAVTGTNEDEQRKLGELEDARADGEGERDDGEEVPMSPQTGGPGLAGMTPPD